MTFPPTCPWCCSTLRLGVICRHPEAARYVRAVRTSIHPLESCQAHRRRTGGAQAASGLHKNESK